MINEQFQMILDALKAIQTQQDEHTKLLQALEHRVEELTAQVAVQGEQLNYVVGEVTRVDRKTDIFAVDVIKLKAKL